MPAAPYSPNEIRRIAAVHKSQLMGTPAEERFDKITRQARALFEVPMACLDIVGNDIAWLKSVQGFDGLEGLRQDSYCHYTVLSDGVCFVHDASKDPRVFDSAFASVWVSYVGVPIHFDNQRIGVLCVGDDKPREFSAQQVEMLADLAALAEQEILVSALSESQIALAAEHEELEMKSRIDVLTHVWNQGAIYDLAHAEFAKVARGTSFALLMIDIDHFKQINDVYGHAAGDQVLRVVAERLRGAVRPSDAVGRYGGEEFLVIIPGLTAQDVEQISERIRSEVVASPVVFNDHQIEVTCSIGCVSHTASQDIRVDSLISHADAALSRAKLAGRNRIEITVDAVGTPA